MADQEHDFDEPHALEWYTKPVQVCRKCGVIRMKPRSRGAFHYYGREHMGTGHERCPAPFAACGTSPAPQSKPAASVPAAEPVADRCEHGIRFPHECPECQEAVTDEMIGRAAPLEMNDAMRDFIEGMSVSIDVSTGDSDAGNRYFGTISEVMVDPHDKHGVTLLVQDAKPNFGALATSAPAAPAERMYTWAEVEKLLKASGIEFAAPAVPAQRAELARDAHLCVTAACSTFETHNHDKAACTRALSAAKYAIDRLAASSEPAGAASAQGEAELPKGWRIDAFEVQEPGIVELGTRLDGEFYGFIRIDTDNYSRPEVAEPIARAIIAVLAATPGTAAASAQTTKRVYGKEYTKAQREWCERYEQETTFEPLMCDFEAGNVSFIQAAKESTRWFENWSGDALLRGCGDIPGLIEAELAAMQRATQDDGKGEQR